MEKYQYLLREYIHKIERYVVAQIRKCDNVLSIFVVGSMGKSDYKIKAANDYDIRVLVTEVTPEFIEYWNMIMDNCVKIAREYYNDIYVSYSSIIGPARYVLEGKKTSLLIHGIVLSSNLLENLAPMHRKSYSKSYYVLYGDDYLLPYSQIKLKLKNIFCDSEGINYCIEHLEKKYLSFARWTIDEGRATLENTSEKFVNETGYEFVRYSITKAVMNLEEYYNEVKEERIKSLLTECENKIDIISRLEYTEYLLDSNKYINMAITILKCFCKLYTFDDV